ncbi:uncharacterized protein LOC111636333 [Centruroides sculpturatus]|uniref:uncharacterized protein LOC111630927 n=1 Tax=Centruroides sculpturatus TaxID=218467 RepID=UPI000C6E15E1|nr:uncharacterized protein LOC111630927 [Centruroides sculpturatus]XP_023237322.1 uncharacterized protein LOC111636333 [Centruroides sculpturatus]
MSVDVHGRKSHEARNSAEEDEKFYAEIGKKFWELSMRENVMPQKKVNDELDLTSFDHWAKDQILSLNTSGRRPEVKIIEEEEFAACLALGVPLRYFKEKEETESDLNRKFLLLLTTLIREIPTALFSEFQRDFETMVKRYKCKAIFRRQIAYEEYNLSQRYSKPNYGFTIFWADPSTRLI